jgi:lysophospholipase L1-like esterase
MKNIGFLLLLSASLATAGDRLKQGNARVVLIGDSITGQSRNYTAGFAHQLDWALKQAYPGCQPNIVALGGSGMGVGAWVNVEKRARTEERFLDVKDIPVKAALDQPADALIIMLGMNDVLAPYVSDDPKSLEQWTAHYREFITALRARLKPSVTTLATATLCTEDVASPKNRMMDKLNAQVAQLATELNLLVLPTNETMRDVLQQGRRRKPDFHVTNDYVHPNAVGHIAVAIGMLRGLGETAAALLLAPLTTIQAADTPEPLVPVLQSFVDKKIAAGVVTLVANKDTLFAFCGNKIWKRKIQHHAMGAFTPWTAVKLTKL